MGDPLARLDKVGDGTLSEPVFARIPQAEPKGLGRKARLPSADDVQGHRQREP